VTGPGDVAWEELAFELGYAHALCAAAERVDELDMLWRGVPRPTYEQKVADRVAEMQRHSERLYADLGRPAGYVYRGGPVSW
jgi:hypothetical protein